MGFGDVAEDALDDAVTGLRSVLADLQGLDLWPPWDAARTLVDLVARAVEIAAQPPEPDPAHLRDAAIEWRLIAVTVDRAQAALEGARDGLDSAVWEGESGDAVRRSLERFATRVDTVPEAAREVATTLGTCADTMEAARKRHADAFDGLREHLTISWGDLWPWELVDLVGGIAGEVAAAIEDLIGAYQDAAGATAAARRGITTAMDGIELPDHLPGSVPSVIDLLNAWSDDTGPLQGSVLARYEDAVASMSPAERARLRDLLDAATDPDARAWIIAAVAAGLTGSALTRYAHRLGTMTPAQVDGLDPGRMTDSQGTQPDSTTCGSSALVRSRMENDPAFAMWILTGYDPVHDVLDPTDHSAGDDPSGVSDRFEDAALTMHETTNHPTDRDGDLQVPWPEALGTQPWALAGEMSADGGSGVPGTSYGVTTVDPQDRGSSFDEVVRASEAGHTVPFYVGDGTYPGHIALVTAASGDSLTVYEPASGESITVTRDDWVGGTFDVGGWSEPWFVVTPER